MKMESYDMSEKQGPDTYFASPETASPELLDSQIQAIASHPLVTAILDSFGGIVIVLNEHRQAIAVNAALMDKLGVTDPETLLGLRMGEILRCSQASGAPSGCGTSKACSTCGGALAILESQKQRKPITRECLLATTQGDHPQPLHFRVKAHPLEHAGHSFTILTLLDIQEEKKSESLQKVFFHDMMNVMTGLVGSADLLRLAKDAKRTDKLMLRIQTAAQTLVDETRVHQAICTNGKTNYAADVRPVSVMSILDAVNESVVSSPVSTDKSLEFDHGDEDTKNASLLTDRSLVQRVVLSMIKNALEATPTDGVVKARCFMPSPSSITFSVWNAGVLSEGVRARIFQRYFTTKGAGRGLGTYAMKLFGEQVLHGTVMFTSSVEAGTVFSLTIPRIHRDINH